MSGKRIQLRRVLLAARPTEGFSGLIPYRVMRVVDIHVGYKIYLLGDTVQLLSMSLIPHVGATLSVLVKGTCIRVHVVRMDYDAEVLVPSLAPDSWEKPVPSVSPRYDPVIYLHEERVTYS